jgi:photosystem II stability/assembly factor-like uncharacterized protein
MLAFADSTHGWAAGGGGILRTSNGGRTWRIVSRAPVSRLDAVGRSTAFALSGDSLLGTRDGRRWREISRPGLVAIDFADTRRGYGLDEHGRLLRTVDGGRRFRRVRAPTRIGGTPPSGALCVTQRGTWIARTNRVWRLVGSSFRPALRAKLNTGPSAVPELKCKESSVWALFHIGVAAGSEAYVVFRSLDGGRNWRVVLANLDQRRARLSRIDSYSGPFTALGGGSAVFAGFCPACGRRQPTVSVLVTADGGRHWRRARGLLDGYTPLAVAFTSGRRGWLLTTGGGPLLASSRYGRVWRTLDGGRHWRPQLRSRLLANLPP